MRKGGTVLWDKEQTTGKEVKRRFQSWFKPSVLDLVDSLYEQDNCRSRSEFMEKAIVFYAGYLSTENAKGYLPNVVTSALKAIVDNSDRMKYSGNLKLVLRSHENRKRFSKVKRRW